MGDESFKLVEPIHVSVMGMQELPPFEYMDDLSEWLLADANAWAEWDQPFKKQAGGDIAIAVLRTAREAHNVCRTWMKNVSNAQAQSNARETLGNYLSRFAKGAAIYSGSPTGQLIRAAAANDPELAVGMVLSYSRNSQHLSAVSLAMIKGQVALSMGTNAVPDSWQSALSEVGDSWSARMSERVKDADKYHQQQRANSRIIIRGIKRLARFQFQRNETQDAILKNHQENMEAMQKTFSEKMTLRAAEAYWGQLRKVFSKRAKNNLFAFAALVLVGGVALWCYYRSIGEWLRLYSVPGTGVGWLMPALVLGLPALIWIWAVRIASGRYQDNTLQSDDAQARVAMLQSFIALEYKGKVSAEERLLILEALYRPRLTSAAGGGIPNPLAAVIVRALERKLGGSSSSG